MPTNPIFFSVEYVEVVGVLQMIGRTRVDFKAIVVPLLGPLGVILILAIAWALQVFPPEGKSITYAIIVFAVPICVFYGLLYGINLTGIGGIKDWINIIKELRGLKNEGVEKPLLELKEISSLIKILKQDTFRDIEIVPDYQSYLKIKEPKIKSRWVFGGTLYHTVNNLRNNLIPYLDAGIDCHYLCGGAENTIKTRAQQIAAALYKENSKYLDNGHLKIYWCDPYHIPLPMCIYNANENDDDNNKEVLITFPYEIETAIEKKCAILIKDKEAVQQCAEKFLHLCSIYKKNKLDLIGLVKLI